MTQSTRYALWLKPEAAADQQLQAVINQLATEYHAPPFAPHITLLGRLFGDESELAAKTETLAGRLNEFSPRVTGFAGAPYYFRCFFSPVASSPELRHAVDEASSTFGASAGSDFSPHISLLYGQLHRDEKKQIPAKIGDAVPRSLTVDRLQLIRMSLSVPAWEIVTEHPLVRG
jgi:2'-5' RNA ligase